MRGTASLSSSSPKLASTDAEKLAALRELAKTNSHAAAKEAWKWLEGFPKETQPPRLAALFAEGTPPSEESVEGDCEGMVIGLFGRTWLRGLDGLARLGRLLGGPGWAGKTFQMNTLTGYNRLTRGAYIPFMLAVPNYRLQRRRDEWLGLYFDVAYEPSSLDRERTVLAIRYEHPRHRNPELLRRTRDELVELIPGICLGRVILTSGVGRSDHELVGHFALRRIPEGERKRPRTII